MLRKPETSKFAVLSILSSVFVIITTSEFSLPEEQPYDVALGGYDDYLLHTNSSTLCLRQCQPGQHKICYYVFHVQQYTVLGGACGRCPEVLEDCKKPQCVTADGYERGIITVNRQLPGPSIQVCEGDWIVVDVINMLPGKGNTIHWHGLHQSLTPWMDGTPMVTQCPVVPGQTFRYYFEAENSGTYFWHSHEGLQKVDGLQGSLIIRKPDSENVLIDLYDFDLPSHILFIQDWLHTIADQRLPGQQSIDLGQSPYSYIINGLGVQLPYYADGSPLPANISTPMAMFHVKQGNRYLFHLIGASCLSCPFRVTFQNHKITVINLGGPNPVKPVSVDSVEMASGERYDVVVEALEAIGAYWILVQGLEEECLTAQQLAILCYEGSTCEPALPISSAINGFDPGYILNPHISNCTEETLLTEICVSQLRSQLETPSRIRGIPDVEIIMPYGFYFFDPETLYVPGTYYSYIVPGVPPPVSSLMKNVSYMTPPSPLLTQYHDIPPSMFCQEDTCLDVQGVCECLNVIEVPTNAVVEFIFIDSTPTDFSLNLSHPFHLHGYDFYVVEQRQYNTVDMTDPSSFLQEFIDSQLKKSSEGRDIGQFVPSKDTILIGTGSYAVLRIITDNPGFWFFHCHYAYHLETGMSFTLQVGKLSQMKPPPPGFPRCNQFMPSAKQIFKTSKKYEKGKKSIKS